VTSTDMTEPAAVAVDEEMSTMGQATQRFYKSQDKTGDGIVDEAERRALARAQAKMATELKMTKTIAAAVVVLLLISLLGNMGLTAAVVYLSKDISVDGKALVVKGTGDPVATHNYKYIYHFQQMDQPVVNATTWTGEGMHVANVKCAQIKGFIQAVKEGDTEGSVDYTMGDGTVWSFPAEAQLYDDVPGHEQFGLGRIYLNHNTDSYYNVVCKADKCAEPGYLCPAYVQAWTPSGRRKLEEADGTQHADPFLRSLGL